MDVRARVVANAGVAVMSQQETDVQKEIQNILAWGSPDAPPRFRKKSFPLVLLNGTIRVLFFVVPVLLTWSFVTGITIGFIAFIAYVLFIRFYLLADYLRGIQFFRKQNY